MPHQALLVAAYLTQSREIEVRIDMRGVQSRALLICQRGRIESFECSRRCQFAPCADSGLTSLQIKK